MHDLKGKKIVVTGGAGFIGSNIVEELLDREADVIVIDNLSTGRIENIKPFLDKITFIEKSITDLDMLLEEFKNVDYVLHQAAIPSIPRSIEDPIGTNNANINGTLNVFYAAHKTGVKRVIYACSSSTYGDVEKMPVHENMPLNPISPYAVQKTVKEMYGKLFHRIYGLDTIGLKYFNVFGPKQDPNSKYSAVIPIFIKSILKDERPTINGDGTTTRDFTYVKNVVNANLLACLAPEIGGHVFNVSSGKKVSINELVQKINEILKKDIKPEYIDFRKGDILHSYANISKAQKMLNYSVEVDFDEGLRRVIEHYIKELG
ncbi:MAG: SDR family oxidoreductase [Candidatus Paceibacterota bacterium]